MVAFDGAHVVVTGGTGALGSAVVTRLREAGAICHVTNLVARELDRFPHKNAADVHVTSGVDLTDEAAVGRFYASLPPLWASIHIAGGFAMAPLAEISAADFEAQFRMNTLSCFLCSRAAVGAIRARATSISGGPTPSGLKGGRIVNVAARPGIEPRLGAGMVAYAASKGAVAAMTQAIAEELASEEIWVNAVAPSVLDTPANRAAMPDAPHDRWVAPAAIAELIVFLASPNNRVTRGAVVPVYAGV
ncbi:MAG TPA: SDR family NAD(P)-dependent oxidoreductase [Stellaceae bacterium]|nr:SDR family NAD(P)-dependent oxidoreductase [Stellaceae bacterium]